MTCVSIMSYFLILNVELSPSFIAKRGIRQGDPMSSYLFVLAMEYLERELKKLTLNGNFNFYPRCKKLYSIHICFADDLLMYSREKFIFVKLLHKAFMRFSKALRFHANSDKT
ncbi:hypothetical protein RDI58_029231 [Solanum bulbocastanum]|uniref:Reverse transcriptase domain-containing protein n=1 Tax=Solanum bulbocastanum TaxID=147425 RepID=A0AAN8STZ0_SOLBU